MVPESLGLRSDVFQPMALQGTNKDSPPFEHTKPLLFSWPPLKPSSCPHCSHDLHKRKTSTIRCLTFKVFPRAISSVFSSSSKNSPPWGEYLVAFLLLTGYLLWSLQRKGLQDSIKIWQNKGVMLREGKKVKRNIVQQSSNEAKTRSQQCCN